MIRRRMKPWARRGALAARRARPLLFALLLMAAAPFSVLARSVALISIDGLRPGDVLEADSRGLKVPVLRRLAAEGAAASGVRGVTPTLTYPSHTTLLTGVAPVCHGIAANLTFDPFQRNQEGWYWYAADIRAPTLWAAARAAGLRVANVHWPVSVGAREIDDNLPQIWRTGQGDDRKLLAALATPGLLEDLESRLGPYPLGIDETVEGDARRARFAADLIRRRRPGFTTVYLAGLDHIEHLYGPGTPKANDALERIDAMVGEIVAAARDADPGADVVVVSDHGFTPVSRDVNLFAPFAAAGLLRLDAEKKAVTAWEAEPWIAGGVAGVVLARPKDPVLKARTAALLAALKADPALGIARIGDEADLKAAGAAPQMSFMVYFAPGFEPGADPAAPKTTTSRVRGMHGYDPAEPAMRSTFIAAGPDVPRRGDLGEIDMRAIAPYVARLLGVPFTPGGGACPAG